LGEWGIVSRKDECDKKQLKKRRVGTKVDYFYTNGT
jgi:hypothetical protein